MAAGVCASSDFSPFLFLTFILALGWANQSGLVTIMVTPGNVEAGGAVAVVESMEETVTMTWGKAQVISGVAIFNISSIAPGTVNRLRIHIILTNPYDMSKVFGNPHAYINVTVSDSHNTTGNVYAWDILYRERAEVLLTPRDAPTGTTTLYIQVSVMVPGGPPPGIQEKTGLVYYCKVELA